MISRTVTTPQDTNHFQNCLTQANCINFLSLLVPEGQSVQGRERLDMRREATGLRRRKKGDGDESKGTGWFKLKRRRKCKWDDMMIWVELPREPVCGGSAVESTPRLGVAPVLPRRLKLHGDVFLSFAWPVCAFRI
jgi:hypothetical protein